MNSRLPGLLESVFLPGKVGAKALLWLMLALFISCKRPAVENQETRLPDVQNGTGIAPVSAGQNGSETAHTAEPQGASRLETRLAAVKRAGEKRSVEAVPWLLNDLMTTTPLVADNVLDYEETYPASKALAEIGEPAVPQISSRFERTKSESERLVLLSILLRIKGKEWLLNYLSEKGNVLPKEKVRQLQGWVSSH